MTWRVLPVAARVQHSNWPAIWLPLILLWPLIIVLLFLVLPLCLLVPTPHRPGLRLLGETYRLLCALHGTHVEFGEGRQNTWSFAVY